MRKLAAGTAYHEDWPVAMDRALVMPSGASFGFACFTDQYGNDVQAMAERLFILTGIGNWVGSSSLGVIGRTTAAQDQPRVALLVTSRPRGRLKVFRGEIACPMRCHGTALLRGGACRSHHAGHAGPDRRHGNQGFELLRHGRSRPCARTGTDGAPCGGISGVAFNEQVKHHDPALAGMLRGE